MIIASERAILQKHRQLIVVRDDLLSEGGSKVRFLPALIDPHAQEVVFGGPNCGGAPLALAIVAKQMGIRCTLFYAQSSHLHWRQKRALDHGAKIVPVPMGFIAVVQKRARDYAQQAGAQFLPLGFDLAAAEEPFVAAMQNVRHRIGDPPEVWCACASGMLTRCLGKAFSASQIKAVIVGLASRHQKQNFSNNVTLLPSGYKDLAQEARSIAPFNCCRNYEKKAWELAVRNAKPNSLFWNVAGDGPTLRA